MSIYYDTAIARHRDQIAEIEADYEAQAREHAAELAELREIDRAYRSILYGAEGRGSLDQYATDELGHVEDRYGEAIDQE